MDLGGYDINIYNGARYLMDCNEAARVLGVRGSIPSRVSLATPGFPRNTMFYVAYDGNFEGHFNRLYLVTDAANKIVSVQLVDEHPKGGCTGAIGGKLDYLQLHEYKIGQLACACYGRISTRRRRNTDRDPDVRAEKDWAEEFVLRRSGKHKIVDTDPVWPSHPPLHADWAVEALIRKVVADNDGSGTRLIDYMALRSTQVHQSEPSISCSVCFRLNWPITTAPRFVRFRLRELRQLG